MKYQNLREEELKSRIGENYFWLYDYNTIIGNVDFCVLAPHPPKGGLSDTPPLGAGGLLWAEAKKGSADLYKSIVQL
ncbi:MAG: hypothetical protein ACOVQA_02780, partial [Thermoflexibacteraceae bacterium]